jgi:hypothetical protein
VDETAQAFRKRLAAGYELGQRLPSARVLLDRPAKHSQLLVELRADRIRRAAPAERDLQAAAAEAFRRHWRGIVSLGSGA